MSALNVAVLCDYAEENWPSMDHAATMLLDRLNCLDGAASIKATRIQPRMKRPFGTASSPACINAGRLINRFWFYPQVARKLPSFDLFHVIDHSYAQLVHQLAPARTVVTCHDIDTFRCLLQPPSERRPLWFRTMVRHTLRGLEKAAAVVCVSNSTREQLLNHNLVAPERVHVVPNGIHPSYNSAPDPYWDAEAARLLGPAGETIDLLHVGSTIPRKCIDVLLRVFAACVRQNRALRLIRVGAPFTAAQQGLLEFLHIEQSTVSLPFLKEELLAAIYRRAALVLIPSDAEGFGLPLAEAMACGTPVVASDIPALREVSAGAASHCTVGAIEQWAETVLAALNEKARATPAWHQRISAGQARATAFNWDRNAASVAAIYRNILSTQN